MTAIWSGYRRALTGLDKRVFVVVGTTFLFVAARMSLVTFIAIYFTRVIHLDLAVVGAGLLVESLARGAFAPLFGAATDRLGRKPLLLLGVGLLSFTLPTFLLVTTPLQLIAWSFVMGVGGAIQQPAASSLLLDLVPLARRQSALALQYTAISLGYTLGVAPAGFIAQRSYEWLAVASTGLFVLAFGLIAWGLRGPLPKEESGASRPSLGRLLLLAPRDRAFLVFASAAIIFPLGLGLTTITSTVFAADRGLDESAIGLILSLNGVLLAIFAIPVQVFFERWGPFRLLGASALVLASSFIALAYLPSIGWALAAHVVLFTVGELVFGPSLPVAVAALAPVGARGAYQGAWGLVFSVGYGLALFVAGLLTGAFGWSVTWDAAFGFSIACAVGLLAGRSYLGRVSGERAKPNPIASAFPRDDH